MFINPNDRTDFDSKKVDCFIVKGNELVETVKKLIHEGNIRDLKIIHEGHVIFSIPLSVGAPAVVAAVLATPVLAALGAFAVLVNDCTIQIEKIK